MGTRARIAVSIAFIAAAVLAFVLFKGGSSSSTTKTAAATQTKSTAPVATTPAFRVIRADVRVGSSGPADGVADIKANAGDRIVITVTSTGFAGEVHLHGFDVHRDVSPGRPAVFDLSPKRTAQPEGQGSFEMELEATATLIARLRVSP